MLKTADRRIGGKEYQITQLPAKPGRSMFIRLLKLAGPAIAAAVKSATPDKDGNFTFAGISAIGLSDAVLELCERLTENEFEEICSIFLDRTQVINPVSGGLVDLEKHFAFAGDYGNLVKLLGWHMEHNFSSFFEGLGITKLPS
jgi:hypothetical protein